MRLRGVEFGHVFCASGARGFGGEGYWFHRLARPFGLDYGGSTFVAKTTTLEPRDGNMPLDDEYRPRALLPGCVVVKPVAGVVLNAVGLSGPGLPALIHHWAAAPPRAPWLLSVMSVAPTAEARVEELRAMVPHINVLRDALLPGAFGLQLNLSCPNAGLDTAHLADEGVDALDVLSALGLPVLVKVNALVGPRVARALSFHPGCDGVVMGNTVPWGELATRIDWQALFGDRGIFEGRPVSPLARCGGGGLSGRPLLPIVTDWIRAARDCGLRKPIVGGGGILSAADADAVLGAGADAVELGSVSLLRPWRVRGIIQHVNRRLQ